MTLAARVRGLKRWLAPVKSQRAYPVRMDFRLSVSISKRRDLQMPVSALDGVMKANGLTEALAMLSWRRTNIPADYLPELPRAMNVHAPQSTSIQQQEKRMKKLTVIGLAFTLLALPALAHADGAATFKAKCAICHGPDGSSDSPMGKKMAAADLRASAVQSKSDQELIASITKGKNKMPKFEEKLDVELIKGVVAFVRTLKN